MLGVKLEHCLSAVPTSKDHTRKWVRLDASGIRRCVVGAEMVGDLGQTIYEWPHGSDGRTFDRPRQINRTRSAARLTACVLIDPHTLNREGLSRLLADTLDGARIDRFDTLNHADKHVLANATVIMVVVKPGQTAIKDCLTALAAAGCPATKISAVLLCERWDMPSVKLALELGVRGCISLSVNVPIVAAALRLVLEGGTYVPPEIVSAAETPVSPATPGATAPVQERAFTPQEHKVLGALLEGKSNKRIARDLALCESTVKVHVRHIMRKLAVTNRTQVALCLMRDARGRPAPNAEAPQRPY